MVHVIVIRTSNRIVIFEGKTRGCLSLVINHGNLDAITVAPLSFTETETSAIFLFMLRCRDLVGSFFFKRGYNLDNPFQAIKSV